MPAAVRKRPATIATTVPLPSLVNFAVTSALASSISSRTMTVVRSATSPSVVTMFSGVGSVGTAPDQVGEDDAADEGGADEDLGMTFDERRRRADGIGDAFEGGGRDVGRDRRGRRAWLGGRRRRRRG